MTRTNLGMTLLLLGTLLMPLAASATEASPQNRSIVLETLPYNPPPDYYEPAYAPHAPVVHRPRPVVAPRLSLRVDPGRDTLRIGDPFRICFGSTRAGFASVWYIDPQGTVQRLYPNRFTGAVARVRAGGEDCVGGGADRFRLIQAGPAGVNDIVLLWTQDAANQPGEGQFQTGGASAQRVGDADYLTIANRNPGSLDALETFVGGVRSVLVQGSVPASRWQTRHIRVFAQ